MKIGFVGLGRMGLNMVKRLLQDNHEIVAFDINEAARNEATSSGATSVDSIEKLIENLPSPKVVWVMVPSGDITENTIIKIRDLLQKDDIIVDGGNSNYKETIRRSELLKEKGINFLDSGTSGGLWGLKNGYCLMIGGAKESFEIVEPVFSSLAPKNGYLHVGPNGAGHFVKMVHNGIEYAMLQAYAEGFEILEAKKDFDLDLKSISTLWNQGSVVRSWLLELAENAFENDPKLEKIKGYVEDSGEGRWTVESAIDLRVPAPTITQALFERFRSRQENTFANRVIAALRNEFGGHRVVKK